MPETTLRDTVLKRLDEVADGDNHSYLLVLAALEGQGELRKQLEGAEASASAPAAAGTAMAIDTATAPATPRIAYLNKLTVEGFRGIGQKATLDLTPGPGLTLVVGRNGSGKSSFAEALAQDKDLSPDVARRVIPGLCRLALEAACMEAFRRRRIGKGESHQAVEAELLEAQTLTNLAALALFGDMEKAGGVMNHLNRVGGRSTGDTFKACNAGAHGSYSGDPVLFVRDVEKLSRWLVAQ